MLEIRQLSIDNQDLYLPVVTDSRKPVFRWKLATDRAHDFQKSARIVVRNGDTVFWDSGEVETDAQTMTYAGEELPDLEQLSVELYVTAESGDDAWVERYFASFTEKFDYPWITSGNTEPRRVVKFLKNVDLPAAKTVKSAFAIYCGLGYCNLTVNGRRTNPDIALDPAFSDYSKTCYFVVDDIYYDAVGNSQLKFCFEVADGWRRFDSPFLLKMGAKMPTFAGKNMLAAKIVVTFTDGTQTVVMTDRTWKWTYSATVTSSIYDGTVFDARPCRYGRRNVKLAEAPCGNIRMMNIPPVMKREKLAPVDIFRKNLRNGEPAWIVDFGRNIAGVVSLEIPSNLEAGNKITVEYSEILGENGDIFTANLRDAKATDVYIAGEPSAVPVFWTPEFTYHGFRFVKVTGYGNPLGETNIRAVELGTALEKTGDFSCGSPILNAIHEACVNTERANMHSILTDCPQRDERLGWMNDATVRFEELPYNFEVARIFPKVLRDIRDTQGEDGSITCTAPFVVGGRPADPVCSSYLVAGLEYYMRTGDRNVLEEFYPGFRAWEECLLAHSDNYIVNYSYYGDWAGPKDSCVDEENARSAVTPGIFMSTGYSYYNCLKLQFFARELGKRADARRYGELAAKIREAFLEKWFDGKTLTVGSDSMACLAFALWLGILPEEARKGVAAKLTGKLRENGWKSTCGNLCSRYLPEVLCDYGYADDAFRMLTDEKYPGFGFMLQNGATTIWERFELKKNGGMNSYNHPMYAAVDRWFYAYVLGIRNTAPGWTSCEITPCLPEGLLTARGSVETPFGRLSVRWAKRYGEKVIMVTVPFGIKCTLNFEGLKKRLTGGSYTFSVT